MQKHLIKEQIRKYENEYLSFMNIEKLPFYELHTKIASLELANSQGFESAASTRYDFQTNTHLLSISENIPISQYLLFHEFTHILDSECYSKGDKVRYMGISGFTEYHASQVELIYLLKASKIGEVPPFSMNTIITTIAGEKTVQKYINEKQQHAIDLFNRYDFPNNIETLKSAIGVLYNYFGLRSICEMYSTNYQEEINNSAFLKFIPTLHFCKLNNIMHGWIEKDKIDLSIENYINIIFPIIKRFNLA